MSLTATMVGIDQVMAKAGGVTTVGVNVVLAGPDLSNGAILEEMQFDVDFTQTVNQIQSQLAAGIRAAVLFQFNQTIPANGVNVLSFTKG